MPGAVRLADGKLEDLIEAAKAYIRANVEHTFRVIKQQRLSKDPTVWPGQEQPQDQGAGSVDKPVPGPA